MCSPEVMARVRMELSRRSMLGALGAAGTAALAASLPRGAGAQGAATPVASPVAGQTIAYAQIVDLSHTHGPEFPMFPGAQQMQMNVLVTIPENGFFKYELILDEHTGTHMDAPAHFIENAATADQLPVEMLVAPLAVVHIHERAASDPDAQVTVDDLAAWETANGQIPAGALVAMHSGWESRVDDPEAYLNVDADGVPHFPGFHPDAAAFLVNERDISGIAVDTISIDYGASQDFGTHVTILGAGKFGLENVANLATVPPAGATVVIGGPKHAGGSGGPTRVLAFV